MGQVFRSAFTEWLNDFHERGDPMSYTDGFTLSCWFYPTAMTGKRCLMAYSWGEAARYYGLFFNGDLAGDPVQAIQYRQGLEGAATTTTGATINTWHHAAAVFYADNNRAVFIDGGSKGTNITSITETMTITYSSIGALYTPLLGNHMDGIIAEVAFHDVALTDEEVAMLAEGFSPYFVQASHLYAYYHCLGVTGPAVAHENDLHGLEPPITFDYQNMAWSGSGGYPSTLLHPPMIYPWQGVTVLPAVPSAWKPQIFIM